MLRAGGNRVLRSANSKYKFYQHGPGLSLGCFLLLLSALLSSAQNLGLGTGSRNSSEPDSTSQVPTQPVQKNASTSMRHDDTSPRKSQLNRRLGLLGRKGGRLDPKMFEARGRELQGQYYEIEESVKNPAQWSTTPIEFAAEKQKIHSRQWLYWVGAAGVVGVSAGTAGFILMGQAHPSASPPKIITLDDK